MDVVYRVAYEPALDDPPDRQRALRDFPAATREEAESAARTWAASRNLLRSPELRMQWPWVMELWDTRTHCWKYVTHLR